MFPVSWCRGKLKEAMSMLTFSAIVMFRRSIKTRAKMDGCPSCFAHAVVSRGPFFSVFPGTSFTRLL